MGVVSSYWWVQVIIQSKESPRYRHLSRALLRKLISLKTGIKNLRLIEEHLCPPSVPSVDSFCLSSLHFCFPHCYSSQSSCNSSWREILKLIPSKYYQLFNLWLSSRWVVDPSLGALSLLQKEWFDPLPLQIQAFRLQGELSHISLKLWIALL